jgi:hypothetical protein
VPTTTAATTARGEPSAAAAAVAAAVRVAEGRPVGVGWRRRLEARVDGWVIAVRRPWVRFDEAKVVRGLRLAGPGRRMSWSLVGVDVALRRSRLMLAVGWTASAVWLMGGRATERSVGRRLVVLLLLLLAV